MDVHDSDAVRVPEDSRFAVMDPRGFMPEVKLVPLAPRIEDLNDKVVYIINSWPEGSNLEMVFEGISELIKNRYPKATVFLKERNTPYMNDDPELWKEMKDRCDTFIYGAAPSCSTTSFAVQ